MILAVTFEVKEAQRAIVSEAVGKGADICYLADLGAAERKDVLRCADVLLARNTAKELRSEELPLLQKTRLIQFLSAGLDYIPLHQHLRAKPRFTACIDAWWVEPARHGEFRMNRPFLELPNVIASPHNSASVPMASDDALPCVLANCRRALLGETPLHLVPPDERVS